MNVSGRSRRRAWALGCTVVAGSVALAACGGSSNSGANTKGSGGNSSGKPGGTLKVLVGTAPDSLDPGFGYTTQALEGDNMVYTPLLQYAFKEGTPGTELIPGLATALPTVSSDKLTYTATLRSGLTYSDGTKVKASDVKYGIERSIKISWVASRSSPATSRARRSTTRARPRISAASPLMTRPARSPST
jgi:peptide/nickel transport system substrate-binding protein